MVTRQIFHIPDYASFTLRTWPLDTLCQEAMKSKTLVPA
ncbi:hypothetical protein KP509_27G037000 [Ceratopteris richardii]|uniref:Uncharacterized protein n=1 Tax=Ceratopteris richardii TaxID=49495 RepID=A0A8T2RFJ8_CERRI|nr:hypothetical protein KP509_27G037000 [Ceratopteris richardii]